jgi:hypothetical protein
MPSYILFMDLIKAFDTTNHDLLFTLLLRYRAPTERVKVIRRLHTYFKLKFTLESLEAIIDYYVSVCQGDNMAPVPFLFQLSVSLFLVPRRYLDGGRLVLWSAGCCEGWWSGGIRLERERLYGSADPFISQGGGAVLVCRVAAGEGQSRVGAVWWQNAKCLIVATVSRLGPGFGGWPSLVRT